MAKNIQVNLTFTADTNAAKQQMAQLQQQLSNLAATPINATPGTKMAQSLQQATQKAVELKVALNNATNVDTGKLNFSKFSQELKRNKTSLQDYAMQLKKLGPEGVQAFSQLANSIRQSETPLISLQGKAAALGKTLANTARWMISSSMLQGVMSAFSGTIDYAKELNESLTSIRVVTGKSAEDMSKFAKEANKAAKTLGATTTEYTDASLIYYQQGLSDKEVKSRTETTIKLANVVGEQASTVSEWMTAIWNNFDDGSQSLEHYADVLAKLGAATASSADEIAGGIEKFAAVSETVGLSYEYAAAALATITAETRQSEDVVGTSLKTIFARIENLKLGETLEDGTTLGQYSEALAKVGVHIQDANGNLRGMDNILNDIGARWDALGKSEQVALAQSVAGIRQYNQFMALMSNWDVMEENVQMAKDANGELEHQHEIWETGLEGATKRVQANLEEIKNSLLDENDLIPLLNIADGFLTVIGDLIDSLGGLPGLLSIIASIGLKIYGPQAASMLMNMTSGIRSLYEGLTGRTAADKDAMSLEASQTTSAMIRGSSMGNNEAAAAGQMYTAMDEATQWEQENVKNINSFYKQQLEIVRQLVEQKGKMAVEAGKEADNAEKRAMRAEGELVNSTFDVYEEAGAEVLNGEEQPVFKKTGRTEDGATIREEIKTVGKIQGMSESFINHNYRSDVAFSGDMTDIVDNAREIDERGASELAGLQKNAEAAFKEQQKAKSDLKGFDDGKEGKRLKELENQRKKNEKYDKDELTRLKNKRKEYKKTEEATTAQLNKSKNAFKKKADEIANTDKVVRKYSGANEEAGKKITNYIDKTAEAAKVNSDFEKKTQDVNTEVENLEEIQDKALNTGKDWTTSFVTGMQGVASAAAGLQMITGAFDSLTTSIADGSAGFSDYLSAITSVLFGLPMLISGIGSINKMLKLNVVWNKLAGQYSAWKAAKDLTAGKAALKSAEEEKAADLIKQTSKLKTVFFNLAEQISQGPKGWIIAAASAVAIAALIGGAIAVNTKKANAQYEEQQSSDIEAGKKAIEVGEGWKEQSDSMDDLIENHKRLQAASANTVESQKEILEAQQAIVDQIPALVDKYKELQKTYENTDNAFSADMQQHIDNIEGMSKAWEKADDDRKEYWVNRIEEITNEADALANTKISKEAWEGTEAATQKTLDAIGKQTGDDTYGGTIKWHVGDFNNSYVGEELAKTLGVEANEGWFGGAGVDIELDTSDSAKFIEQYEKLQKFVDRMREEGKSDDTLRELAEGLDASKEAYEELKELYGDSQDFRLSELMQQKGINPSAINSYKDFLKIRKEFVDLAVKEGIATEEQAENYFDAQKTLSSYTLVEKTALTIKDEYGAKAADTIKEYAKGLSEEELELFLSINFDEYHTEQAYDTMIKYLKSLAKSDKLTLEFKADLKTFGNLKSNMSMEDYEKLKDQVNWGEDGLIEFSEFLSKSFEDQQNILANRMLSSANKTLEELKLGLKILEDDKEKLTGQDREAIEEDIEEQKIRIALIEQGSKDAEEAIYKEEKARQDLLKSLREEIDLYFKLNNLKKQSEVLSEKIGRAKDRAFGKAKLELMKLEQKALENEIKLNEKTIEQNKIEAEQNKQRMAESIAALNEEGKQHGFQIEAVRFDDYGNVDNYTEIQRQYNQALADLDLKVGKESPEYKRVENTKKYFEDYVKAYQSNLETTLDLTEENAEKEQAIWDSKLEGLEYELEIKVKVNDRQLAKLERRLKRLDDDKYDGAERIAVYQGQAREQLDIIDDNKNTIRNTLRNSGVSEEDINSYMAGNSKAVAGYNLDSGTIDILEKSTDNILNAQSALEDIDEAVKEQLMTSFGAIHDEIASIGDDLDRQVSILGNYQNIIDLVGKEQLGITDEDVEAMEKLANDAAQAKVQNAKANMDLTRSTLETVRKNMAELDPKVDKEAYEYWQKREEELNKQLQEDTETFTSLWAEAIQTAYDTFSKQTERAIDDFSDAIAGANFGSMEELQEAYDRQVELSDRYVENYKQAYELSKLNRKINQDLSKTDNIKSQKVLRDLQKEIEGIQKSGRKLTDYELNALQKKYDLKLAEIALEDTQNAKSTVRLRRDSEGNFGYVYTANQNEMDKAQQNYEDKLYSMQELNDNYLEELQKSIISNRLEMVEELKALDALEIKDKKEYEKKKSAIIEKYTNNEKFMLGEMQKVFTNNQSIRDTDLAQYGTYQIGYQNKTTDWITTFGNTTLSMKTGFDNVEGFQKNLNDAIGDPKLGTGLLGEFDKAYKNLESNLDETFKQAGVDLGDFGKDNTSVLGPDGTAQTAFTSFKDHVNTAMYGENGVNASINSAKDTTKTLAKEGKEALIGEDGKGGLAKAVSDWYDEYGTKMKQGKKDAENLDNALTNLIGQYDIDININVNEDINALTAALKGLREEIDKNKGIIKQQEQQIKDNQLETSELTDENSKYTIQAFGTYGGGYAAVQLNNGNWYGARGFGVNAVDNKVGDTITLRPGTTIDDYFIQTPDDYSNQETDDFVLANHTATEDSSSWNPKAAGYKDNPYGGRQYKEWNGEVYIKAKTSDYWYKESELGKRKYEYKHGSDKLTATHYFIRKGQQAYTSSFDTGGYTGSWGPEGRLAMLHQKEIVLNAHDTENLLTAVSMIREISDKLESNALAMRYLSAIGNYNAAINTNNHDTLQQEVTIHAEFPNATNHSEIEEAFDNLVNLASQYANRK